MFLHDPYVIRAQIALHAQPRTTPPNRVKFAQKSGFDRDPYAILPIDLCDQAFRLIEATTCAVINNNFISLPATRT